jgi:hypothetical protein
MIRVTPGQQRAFNRVINDANPTKSDLDSVISRFNNKWSMIEDLEEGGILYYGEILGKRTKWEEFIMLKLNFLPPF